MGLKDDFVEHIEKAKALPGSTSKKDKDVLYGLYMQSIYGPVMTVRPGLYNRKDPCEWEAWNAVKAKSTEEAMSEYTNKVKQLLATTH